MKPAGLCFDKACAAASVVYRADVATCREFIEAHYLKKRPAITLLCMIMEWNAKKVGCVVYSAPPRETEKRYGGKTWELARLYLLDEVPKNAETWLIAQSVKFIRRVYPDVKVLVSYADPSAGHKGTIYKAANWSSDGMTDEGRKTPRCDYVAIATGKKYGRKGNIPPGVLVERVPRVSKHRFVLRLK